MFCTKGFLSHPHCECHCGELALFSCQIGNNVRGSPPTHLFWTGNNGAKDLNGLLINLVAALYLGLIRVCSLRTK